jgi:hypothetical protein
LKLEFRVQEVATQLKSPADVNRPDASLPRRSLERLSPAAGAAGGSWPRSSLHGERLVYEEAPGLWSRTVIDLDLRQGHALGWPTPTRTAATSWPPAGWQTRTAAGQWAKTHLDSGVAVEDLAFEDLNADGHPELITGGRATGNIRIHWNERR